MLILIIQLNKFFCYYNINENTKHLYDNNYVYRNTFFASYVLSKIHFKVENFANLIYLHHLQQNPIEDNLYDKLNNKDLTIKDFYPQIKKPLQKQKKI